MRGVTPGVDGCSPLLLEVVVVVVDGGDSGGESLPGTCTLSVWSAFVNFCLQVFGVHLSFFFSFLWCFKLELSGEV